MALPTSGIITAAMINKELGRAETAPFNLNDATVRALAGKPSGPISFSDFYGKSMSRTTEAYFTLDWGSFEEWDWRWGYWQGTAWVHGEGASYLGSSVSESLIDGRSPTSSDFDFMFASPLKLSTGTPIAVKVSGYAHSVKGLVNAASYIACYSGSDAQAMAIYVFEQLSGRRDVTVTLVFDKP